MAGFNIIRLGTDSAEFLKTKQAFLEEINRKTVTKHHIHTFGFLEFKRAFEKLASREHAGKVLLKFD